MLSNELQSKWLADHPPVLEPVPAPPPKPYVALPDNFQPVAPDPWWVAYQKQRMEQDPTAKPDVTAWYNVSPFGNPPEGALYTPREYQNYAVDDKSHDYIRAISYQPPDSVAAFWAQLPIQEKMSAMNVRDDLRENYLTAMWYGGGAVTFKGQYISGYEAAQQIMDFSNQVGQQIEQARTQDRNAPAPVVDYRLGV